MFILYLILVNLGLFVVMGYDKLASKRGEWRIPERTLFLLAAIGGSVGGICGMRFFRHKTKHAFFAIGFPCILAIQVVGVITLLILI